jgi:competence protein ComEC
LFLLLWFVALARGEPSVLRAAFMAGVVATNALRGKPMNARSVIALTAMLLLIIDSLLAWSIGFALSVGATLGLAWLSHPLEKIVGTRGGMASTIAALVGTMPVSFAIFGNVPLMSLIANPLSLAVAGAVMMIGLPLAILGGIWSPFAVVVSWLMVPPVAWVAGVAAVCSRVSPAGWWNLCGWLVVVVFIVARMRNSATRPTSVAG